MDVWTWIAIQVREANAALILIAGLVAAAVVFAVYVKSSGAMARTVVAGISAAILLALVAGGVMWLSHIADQTLQV